MQHTALWWFWTLRTEDCSCTMILYITMTMNPKWDEISANLQPGQEAQDWPDLMLEYFIWNWRNLWSFYRIAPFVSLKLGFIQLHFRSEDCPMPTYCLSWSLACRIEPDDIDKVIVAEIPSHEMDPKLHSIVKANMVHGTCGIEFKPHGVWMANGTCSKKYPREFISQTQHATDR